jgi:ubiquinone/menaquinone biosynthesis C-methylase UbiE
MEQFLADFKQRAQTIGWEFPKSGAALDLGCGVGETTACLSEDFQETFGLDLASDSLTVASKINSEKYSGRIHFMRCAAEDLPFKDETLNLVVAQDVIEHVQDPGKMLSEIERVLLPNGIAILQSPNKFNLFSKDGHVHVRFVGFVPAPLQDTYVRTLSGQSWTKRNVHLLSYQRLRALAGSAKSCSVEIFVAHGRWFKAIDNFCTKVPLIGSSLSVVVRTFVPGLFVLMRKEKSIGHG